jgi:hypothetical protein
MTHTAYRRGSIGVVPIPKCASSSVSGTLRGAGFRLCTTDDLGSALVLTVVRDPLDRLASSWWNLVADPRPGTNPLLDGDMPRDFLPFVRMLADDPTLIHQDPHLLPQSSYLAGVPVTTYLRFEALDVSWALVGDIYGLAPLKRLNSARPGRPSATSMYDDETLSFALELYRDDVALWSSL